MWASFKAKVVKHQSINHWMEEEKAGRERRRHLAWLWPFLVSDCEVYKALNISLFLAQFCISIITSHPTIHCEDTVTTPPYNINHEIEFTPPSSWIHQQQQHLSCDKQQRQLSQISDIKKVVLIFEYITKTKTYSQDVCCWTYLQIQRLHELWRMLWRRQPRIG